MIYWLLAVLLLLHQACCDEQVVDQFEIPGKVQFGPANLVSPTDPNGYLIYCPCMGKST